MGGDKGTTRAAVRGFDNLERKRMNISYEYCNNCGHDKAFHALPESPVQGCYWFRFTLFVNAQPCECKRFEETHETTL